MAANTGDAYRAFSDQFEAAEAIESAPATWPEAPRLTGSVPERSSSERSENPHFVLILSARKCLARVMRGQRRAGQSDCWLPPLALAR